MKLLRVVMTQCEKLKSLKPDEYLGVRIGSCPDRIEHIVVSNRRVHIVSKRCEDCVLAKLIRSTHVIGQPVLKGGTITFIVRADKYSRNLIKKYSRDIIDISELDYRELYLTERQKQVLRLMVSGEASNISRIARKLGISKPAALKLVRNSIRKLAKRYS